MSSTLGAVALAATLGAVAPPPPATDWSPPAYPLPGLSGRCLEEPCADAVLTDLLLAAAEPGGPVTGKVRLRLHDRLFLEVRSDDQQGQGITLAGARWDLGIEHHGNQTDLAGEYRAPRLRFRTTGRRFGGEGNPWGVTLGAALRLNRDLELVVEVDEGGGGPLPSGPARQPSSRQSLGFLWQRGAILEVEGAVASARVETPAGIELDSREIGARVTYQARRSLLAGGLRVEELSGRFERREMAADLRLAHRLAPRLVTEVALDVLHEADLGSLSRDFGVSLAWYARRFRFSRGGDAGARTVELAYRAAELGFNERRSHDLEGRRRLRERLGLAARTESGLEPWIRELYRAQVDERNVPLVGFGWRREADNLDGSRLRQVTFFAAIPWAGGRPSPALAANESAVEFLRLVLARSERTVSSGFTTEGTTLALELALNRELGLRVAWEEPAATGLDLAIQTPDPGRISARLQYRLGL